ncbi:MAG TPA: radical SAM protein [Bacteroidales bacterium]|nr:radical SAM protein [Bacteroidales bacterium]
MSSTKKYRIPQKIAKQFNKIRSNHRYLCHAPFSAISIGYDGQVGPCCYTLMPDTITGNAFYSPACTLKQIWEGEVFAKYRKLIRRDKLPPSCSLCREKLLQNNFDSVKIQEFDQLMPQKKFPALIELNIDNTCNLECVMCSSVNSSKIAARSGIKTRQPDSGALFRQLQGFLPHTKEVIFSGGEPFMSEIYFRIWEELISVNPGCIITLNTNASFISSRAKEIIEQGNFKFNISIDSIVKETYEKIRVNSKFETFSQNFDYLCDYSARHNVPVSAPVCPLTLNYKEIPGLIKFCNGHSAYMVFLHVFGAHSVALNAASVEILEDALHIFNQTPLPENNSVEKHNALRFRSFIAEVKNWIDQAKMREAFIKNLDLNAGTFQKKYDEWQNRLCAGLLEKSDKEVILDKTKYVFEELPAYFKSEIFIATLDDYPPETFVPILRKLPAHEVAELFRIIFNQRINP